MKPLVIGHRGASAYAPENTLAAFNLAFDMGADGVELDVELTKDGVPMVFHFDDPRHPKTHGIRSLRQMTLDEVKCIDAGMWFSGKFRGEKMPTLAQVLEAIGGRGQIIVEVKWSDVEFGKDALERATAQVIQQASHAKDLVISSFHPFALYRMARLLPHLPRALIYQTELMPMPLNGPWFRWLVRPQALHTDHQMLTPQYVVWARSKGYAITAWHPDEPEEMHRVVALGVDGIMSNKPDVLRKVVDGR